MKKKYRLLKKRIGYILKENPWLSKSELNELFEMTKTRNMKYCIKKGITDNPCQCAIEVWKSFKQLYTDFS